MKIFTYFLEGIKKKPIRTALKTIVIFLFLLVIVHFGVVIHYIKFNRQNMPDINTLVKFEPPIVGTIYDSEGKPIINLANEFRWIVRPNEIPEIVKYAVLSAEDRSFYQHGGISLRDIGRAFWIDIGHIIDRWLGGQGIDLTPSQGASTLDQQLARSVYLQEQLRLENSGRLINDNYFTRWAKRIYNDIPNINRAWRKIEEARLALWINEEFRKPEYFGSDQRAKDEILARYLTFVYVRYVYGFKAGARFYFDKDLKDFTLDDADKAAFLAGVIKNPSRYAPRLNQKEEPSSLIVLRQINRRNAILDQMVENKYISPEQATTFKEREIPIPTKDIRNFAEAPSVVNQTFIEVKNSNFKIQSILGGNINIQTTVDLRIQKIVNEACENGLAEYEKRYPEYKNQTQCSAIAMKNSDASILAEVGGRKTYQGKDYQYSDLNRVNRARQAGSAFKPFVYLTAFSQGFKPDDNISDAPFPLRMGDGKVHWVNNYDNKSLGSITLCEALYRSRNTPTVRLVKEYIGQGSFEESGMKQVIDMTRLLGIKSPYHTAIDHLGRTVYYPTSALGASEMTVIELANAYREIASGLSAEPYIIKKITSRNGSVLFEKQDNKAQSEVDPEALKTTLSCLRKVVTQPGGTAHSLTVEKFPVAIAGKTGTTDDFRNALFAGSTYGPEGITIVARVDFDDNRELGKSETGARTALPIVKEIFKKIYEQNLVGPAPLFPEEIENLIYNSVPAP